MADQQQPPPNTPLRPPPKELNQQKAAEKFKEFWKEPVTCPVCKTADWAFGRNLAHLFHVSDLVASQIAVITAVPVLCKKCGYIMLFSAEMLGLSNA